jgi:chorismate mutase
VSDSSSAAEALAALRASFDDVDARLIALLAQRTQLSIAAGRVKHAHGLPIVDEAREANAATKRAELARQHGLDVAFVDEVFGAIVKHSRRAQGAR